MWWLDKVLQGHHFPFINPKSKAYFFYSFTQSNYNSVSKSKKLLCKIMIAACLQLDEFYELAIKLLSIYMPNTVTNSKNYSRCEQHTLTLLSPYIVFSSLPWLSGMVSQLLMWSCAVFLGRMSSKIVSECLFPISGKCLYRDVIK